MCSTSDEISSRVFAEGVDDEARRDHRRRDGLTRMGWGINCLGAVYRLRFGLARLSYAVLDTSNALADEAEVVYAEPDLIHTVEEDAAVPTVAPTDFLFPQQWDHSIINTPDAWQVLRDRDVNRTFGSPDVIIAVVDSLGVDASPSRVRGQRLGWPIASPTGCSTSSTWPANMNNLVGDDGTALRECGYLAGPTTRPP